ncbi:unnamed protein product [Tilletia controversa]|nr:unnamed protein product [Tilletia controversa]
MAVTVGVLALQGAFHEHAAHINSLAPAIDVSAALVRTPTDLARCQALIIPGGESTAIALGAQRAGLIDPLRHWVAAGRPTWGTCAGMILLSNQAIGAKKGGQSLIGGVDIRVGRNGFGSQVDSFEAGLVVPALGEEPFPGVFIRAPVIDALLLLSDKAAAAALPGLNGAAVPIPASLSADLPAIPASHIPSALANGHAARANAPPPTIVCAEPPPPSPIPFSPTLPPKEHVLIPTSSASVLASESGSPQPPPKALATMATTLLNPEERPALDSQIVALRQGNILVSSFHPELTVDSRFHEYFVRSFVLGSS